MARRNFLIFATCVSNNESIIILILIN